MVGHWFQNPCASPYCRQARKETQFLDWRGLRERCLGGQSPVTRGCRSLTLRWSSRIPSIGYVNSESSAIHYWLEPYRQDCPSCQG
jgi:hypothetical protein